VKESAFDEVLAYLEAVLTATLNFSRLLHVFIVVHEHRLARSVQPQRLESDTFKRGKNKRTKQTFYMVYRARCLGVAEVRGRGDPVEQWFTQ
jgi:hypothetical protein